MTLYIISLCLNVEWSFKCKYGIKAVWAFLTWAQQCYLAAFFPSYNNLMLFAWAGFVSAIRTFVYDANESHLNMSERDRDDRTRQRKCVLECVCVVIFGQNIKNTAEQQDSLFCLHHISHKHAYTVSIHSQTLSTHISHNHTNAANHSSIFYARMHKTLASFCKLQLMCMWERKHREASWEYKSSESEWERQMRREKEN